MKKGLPAAMSEPPIVSVIALVAGVAAMVVLAPLGLLRLRRLVTPGRASVCGLFGVVAGLVAGLWAFDLWPHWPPTVDQDRFLLILLPAVVVVEIAGAFLNRSWVLWALRLPVIALAGRVLLHNTVYLVDLSGPGTAEWSTLQAVLTLGGLAGALLLLQVALDALARRTRGTSALLGLALVSGAAGVTVMLSGYLSGGRLGLVLGAALAGTAVGTILFPGEGGARGSVTLAVVGLFGVLVMGRFFGSLTIMHGVLLFLAPLLAWLPELPPLRRLWTGARSVLRVGLVAIPLVIVVPQAYRQFQKDSQVPSQPGEPSLQDYIDYQKEWKSK
jgi:hypothetical protein